MKSEKKKGLLMKRSISLTAVIGSILVLLVVTAAAVWTAAGTRTAADHAAFAVSEFYLEELAGRRSEIVTSFLETKAQQIERAVSLLNPKILESQETLRKYIGNVEAIQGMGLFALVDEDNVVYTEFSTYNGGRVSKTKRLSTLSVGDAALRGYLVGQSVAVSNNGLGTVSVNYTFVALSPQGQGV